MKEKYMFFYVILLFFISCGQCKRKNILFLVADDMRPNIGAYEDANADTYDQPPMHTPNLDSLGDFIWMILDN